MSVPRGTVVWLDPDPTPGVGREQSGRRPAVIIGDDTLTNSLRFSMLAVVPLTTRSGLSPNFYPVLSPSPTGLKTNSTALPDQIRAVDKSRVTGRIGMARPREIEAIESSLRRFLKLP